jgi:hypothetical protein
MSQNSAQADIHMHFYIKATIENTSLLFDILNKSITRNGIEIHYRSNWNNLNDIKNHINNLIINKSIGNLPYYCFDTYIKPDLLIGITSPIKK